MAQIVTIPLSSADAYLYQADCRDVLRELPPDCIDSVVTDPPYHLSSIVKRFGKPGSAPAQFGSDGRFSRASAGFMGKEWDGGDIAFTPELWAEVWRVLKPGGHLVAFGAPRNYHRLAVAIEDAGFEVRDTILNILDPNDAVVRFMESLSSEQLGLFLRCLEDSQFAGLLAWCFATGFPKSHNVALSVDKESGAIGHLAKSFNMKGGGDRSDEFADNGRDFSIKHVPATDAAAEWEGWGTALKPAFEPIVLCRKPLSEKTVAANVLKWRTGAINIDACRVPCEPGVELGRNNNARKPEDGTSYVVQRTEMRIDNSGGKRWPANICHDGSAEVIEAFPHTKSGSTLTHHKIKESENTCMSGKNYAHSPKQDRIGDEGSAARFFYSAKANKTDRQGTTHPTTKPTALMQWLSKLVTPPGGVVLDPFAGSGSTGIACVREGFKAVLIEREREYIEMIVKRFLAESAPRSDVA